MKIEKKRVEFGVIITLTKGEAEELSEQMGKLSTPTDKMHFKIYSELDDLLMRE